MAFDQHIEADHVGDDGIGLFSSIIARPILWLLGVDQDKAAEEKRKEERKQLERDVLEASDVSEDDADNDENGVDNERCEGGAESSFTCAPTNRDGDMDIIDKGGGGGDPHNNNRGSYKGGDSENQSNQIMSSTLKSWPQAGAMGASTSIHNSHPPRRGNDCSHATQIVDDLVAVMENSTIDPTSKGPATSAMNSRCELSSSTHSLSASHSASAFPNQEISPKHPLHKAYSSNSIKWSDEHGSRPLVEYSDDHLETVESKHWTQLRRKKRRSSFDNVDENRSGTRRSQVRVIKSALRSGSYSPPVTMMCARGGVPPHSTSSTSSSSSSNQAASGGQLRSFHSLSMIGSSSGSSSADSMSVSANSSDSLAALTSAKLSMKDNVQCVPSTLQQGGGRATGGLIIPRGGPSGAYHLTMGTRASGEPQDQVAAKENQAEDGANGPTSNNNNLINGRMQAKAPSPHHHMFMPHPNGGVSPQYGFYVNITPPTPLHAAAVKRGSPLRPFEESSPQQQSFHGFSPVLPSPIPEVELAKEKGAAPTLAPFSESVEAPAVKNMLKPTFPKNRVGMGMVLAGNHHHHAWPSIPMG